MARFVPSQALIALTAVLLLRMAPASVAGQEPSVASGFDSPRISIDLARGTPREQLAKQTLEQALASHDVGKYTFTRKVVIEQGAINHAFPVLTLNPYFASSPDELLSTYIHEQLHWHLRNRAAQQQAAITELRRLYPHVPVGLPASAENEYSTYGHLVDCYLEILADRQLLGPERNCRRRAEQAVVHVDLRHRSCGRKADRRGCGPPSAGALITTIPREPLD